MESRNKMRLQSYKRHMIKKENFKEFLIRNKIYFETVMSILVSLAAVFVGIVSMKISHQQLIVSQIELLPKFTISAHQEKSGRNDYIYDEDNIYIKNSGGYFKEFYVNVVTKIIIEKNKNDPFKERKEERYLWNYYDGTAYSAGSIEQPAKIIGYKNNMEFVNLKREYRKKLEELGYWGDLGLERYIEIEYKDAFEKKHKNYYRVDLIYGSHEIDNKVGEKIFKENMSAKNKIDFMNVNFNVLNNIIEY